MCLHRVQWVFIFYELWDLCSSGFPKEEFLLLPHPFCCGTAPNKWSWLVFEAGPALTDHSELGLTQLLQELEVQGNNHIKATPATSPFLSKMSLRHPPLSETMFIIVLRLSATING